MSTPSQKHQFMSLTNKSLIWFQNRRKLRSCRDSRTPSRQQSSHRSIWTYIPRGSRIPQVGKATLEPVFISNSIQISSRVSVTDPRQVIVDKQSNYKMFCLRSNWIQETSLRTRAWGGSTRWPFLGVRHRGNILISRKTRTSSLRCPRKINRNNPDIKMSPWVLLNITVWIIQAWTKPYIQPPISYLVVRKLLSSAVFSSTENQKAMKGLSSQMERSVTWWSVWPWKSPSYFQMKNISRLRSRNTIWSRRIRIMTTMCRSWVLLTR